MLAGSWSRGTAAAPGQAPRGGAAGPRSSGRGRDVGLEVGVGREGQLRGL